MGLANAGPIVRVLGWISVDEILSGWITGRLANDFSRDRPKLDPVRNKIHPVSGVAVNLFEADRLSTTPLPPIFVYTGKLGNDDSLLHRLSDNEKWLREQQERRRVHAVVDQILRVPDASVVVVPSDPTRDFDTTGYSPDRLAVATFELNDRERQRRFDKAVFANRPNPWGSTDLDIKRNGVKDLCHALGIPMIGMDNDVLIQHEDDFARMVTAIEAGAGFAGFQLDGYRDRSVLGHIEDRAGWYCLPFGSGSASALRVGYPGSFLRIYNDDRFALFAERIFKRVAARVAPQVFVSTAVQVPLENLKSPYDAHRARQQAVGDFLHDAVVAALEDSTHLWDRKFWRSFKQQYLEHIDDLIADNEGEDRKDFHVDEVRDALHAIREEVEAFDAAKLGPAFMGAWADELEWASDPARSLFSDNPRHGMEIHFGSSQHLLPALLNGERSNVVSHAVSRRRAPAPLTAANFDRWARARLIEVMREPMASPANLAHCLLGLANVADELKSRRLTRVEAQKLLELARRSGLPEDAEHAAKEAADERFFGVRDGAQRAITYRDEMEVIKDYSYSAFRSAMLRLLRDTNKNNGQLGGGKRGADVELRIGLARFALHQGVDSAATLYLLFMSGDPTRQRSATLSKTSLDLARMLLDGDDAAAALRFDREELQNQARIVANEQTIAAEILGPERAADVNYLMALQTLTYLMGQAGSDLTEAKREALRHLAHGRSSDAVAELRIAAESNPDLFANLPITYATSLAVALPGTQRRVNDTAVKMSVGNPTSTPSKPSVLVVVASYGMHDNTVALVEQTMNNARETRVQVCVVDMHDPTFVASDDRNQEGPYRPAHGEFVVAAGKRVSWPRAITLGLLSDIRAFDYVLHVNRNTALSDQCVDALVGAYRRNSDAGIVVPADDSDWVHQAHKGTIPFRRDDSEIQIPFAPSNCMLFSMELMRSLPFPATGSRHDWGRDIVWSRAVRERGQAIYKTSSASAVHERGRTEGSNMAAWEVRENLAMQKYLVAAYGPEWPVHVFSGFPRSIAHERFMDEAAGAYESLQVVPARRTRTDSRITAR